MKTLNLITAILSLLFYASLQSQELSKPNIMSVGIASSYPAYGVSAKYNFTEVHAGQVIVGGASYGFGANSLAVTGRYLYNFTEEGSSFIYKPYIYGQTGYFSVKYDFLGTNTSYSTVSFGVGGGVEFTFEDFIDGIAFNADLGYVNGSFNNGIGSFGGFAWGGGIHYSFNL
jgi:hypothetical protein